jgi:WD40 repeat protein
VQVVIWDNTKNKAAFAVGDGSNRPLRVLLSKRYFVPVCETGLALFRLASVTHDFDQNDLLHSYPTISNPHAVSVLGSRFLAFPGISRGKLQVVDLINMKSAIINAHSSHLRAIALSPDEELLATTSDRGTLVRIWSTSSQSRLAEFRRGLEESAIFHLAFSPGGDLLALTSGKGTIHIFELSPPVVPDSPKSSDYGRRPSDASKHPSHSRQSSTSKPQGVHRANRLSFPPAQKDPMSHSTILTSSDPADQDPGMPNWTHISQKKAARFQDQPPASLLSADQQGYAYSDYAQSGLTTGSSASGSGAVSKAKKYGGLANLPFAPRVFKDQYSVCSVAFTLPGRVLEPSTLDDSTLFVPPPTIPPPTVGSSSTHRRFPSAPQGKNLTHGLAKPSSLAQGAPPKGQIAWVGDLELVVVSAGRGGRWERFEVERGMGDGRPWSIRCVGWKAYLDEEGG